VYATYTSAPVNHEEIQVPSTTQRSVALPPGTRLAALFHHLDRHRRALESTASLGTAELRLLWLLSDGRGRTLREIADELHLEQSTVNRQVNAALRAGHLRRTRVEGAYRFEPTPSGSELFTRETGVALSLYARVLDDLGPERADVLLSALGEFVDRYGAVVEERTDRGQ
jgi:DNA-binding MarR family transcriptional regulator